MRCIFGHVRALSRDLLYSNHSLSNFSRVLFCFYTVWQRGSNENTNGLLEQYLPKGIDISSYSQAKLNTAARQLEREAKEDTWHQTPAEMFSHTVRDRGGRKPTLRFATRPDDAAVVCCR